MTIMNLKAGNHIHAKMFFDENGSVGVARYDTVKYPEIANLAKKQRGFYWAPEEVDINNDRDDFANLQPHEQRIFTANLKRQILLDSVQGRAPALMLNPITALPELENLANTWTFFEGIHSETYTHVIRNIYPNPSEVFDTMTDIPEIVACADDIARYYDDFYNASLMYQRFGIGTFRVENTKTGVIETITVDAYDLKKKLWLMLMSINVLEGVRFYVSFACSWAFAETKRMEGNAKLIQLICRDENLHLSATQRLLKVILFKDDPDYRRIAEETHEESMSIYRNAIAQEKTWAKYLFAEGSMLGLSEIPVCQFIDWRGALCMRAVGLTPDFDAPKSNPMTWIDGWISSKGRQEAPQETEKSQYTLGGVKQDVPTGAFKGFRL